MKTKYQISKVDYLTQREVEVLQVVSDGLTTKEIATKFYVSIKTVESHRTSLLLKFGVSNVALLIKKATQLGLVK